MSVTQDLNGKRCLVTGANSGIGWITARRLAERGAELWLLCRDEGRGETALEDLRRDCLTWGSPEPRLILADLSDLESVRSASQRLGAELDRLDILVNNAGLILTSRRESPQGHELTLAINHLGPFALTLNLLPLLENAPQGRIVNVASEAHRVARVDWDDLQWLKRRFSSFTVYGTTKLYNILFTRALAKRLAEKESAVTVNSLHPGVIRSGFGKDDSGIVKLLSTLAGPFLISAERGAKTSIHLAASPEVTKISGEYFIRRRPARPRPLGRSDEQAERLWNESLSLCEGFLPDPLPEDPRA